MVSDDDSFEPFFEEVDDSAETHIEADEDRELNLESLISLVNSDDILEIWKISRYNYPKSYQHVILLSTGNICVLVLCLLRMELYVGIFSRYL